MLDITPDHSDRHQALDRLRRSGINPYPPTFAGRKLVATIQTAAEQLAAGEALTGPALRAAGRLVALRRMGRIAFMDLRDRSGTLQVMLDERVMGEEAFAIALEHQRGDHVGATGHPIRTRAGEPSLNAIEITMLSKALIPTNDGLRDREARQRHREADLISNAETRERIVTRAEIIRTVRNFMHDRDFVEVETPILQPIYGGAAARPFITHHDSLGQRMYLRIAPELYLKRCIVGDLERVFEIGKNFRNEGMSAKHNPEFTVIEWYEAYADYTDLARQVEQLVHRIALAIAHSDPEVFAPPWPRVRLHEAILELTGIDILSNLSASDLRATMLSKGIPADETQTWPALVDFLQSAFVEPTFARPTFLVDHPVALSPLAKTHRQDPRLTERFEAIIDGVEIANAFTELNDPIEQRERFLTSNGEASYSHPVDEDFIQALGRGMPPTAGCGIGLDRLVMLMVGASSIRDVILFPAMRPIATNA